jgi:hypothetical protein
VSGNNNSFKPTYAWVSNERLVYQYVGVRFDLEAVQAMCSRGAFIKNKLDIRPKTCHSVYIVGLQRGKWK